MIDRGMAVIAALCASAMAVPISSAAQSGDGFLFGTPRGSISLRGGFTQPTASSDVWAFSKENLTLGRSDFAGTSLSAEVSYTLTNRVALEVSAGVSGRTVGSTFRDWVDNNDMEIEQSSVLRRAPVMVGLRYYLVPPGRTLGRLAWVPTRLAPYVTAGVGSVWYKFKQTGDFVDYQTLDVFHTTLESSSWAPSGYGAAGVDYALTAWMGLVSEARYDYARARMGDDFAGFDRIDLSGFSATLGLAFRF